MRKDNCRNKECIATAVWPSCSVGDFMRANPGWLWVPLSDGKSAVLCPKCAKTAAELAAKLHKYLGEYDVHPMLLRQARELGLLTPEIEEIED